MCVIVTCAGRGLLQRGTAGDRSLDLLREAAEIDRLGDVTVESGLKCSFLVALHRVRGQREHAQNFMLSGLSSTIRILGTSHCPAGKNYASKGLAGAPAQRQCRRVAPGKWLIAEPGAHPPDQRAGLHRRGEVIARALLQGFFLARAGLCGGR